jgi:hypothetical protein
VERECDGEWIVMPWKRCAKMSGAISMDFSPHDLCRSFATTTHEANALQEIVDQLQNHFERKNVSLSYISKLPEKRVPTASGSPGRCAAMVRYCWTPAFARSLGAAR